jgi:RHS repeat-associated protein
MARVWIRQAFVGALLLVGACSDGRRAATEQEEPAGVQQQSLTATQTRILGFEGTIGGSNGDWRAVTGTATSSTVHSEGTRSLSLSGSTSPSARSTALSTLGTLASQAAIDVQVPTSLQGQSWLGQVALTFNAPSAGVNNINAGAATLSGPVGTFRRYTITIPQFVVTALNTHTYSDLTLTVQLTVPSTSGAFLVDALTLTPGGGGGTGGAGGMAGGGGTAGGGTAGGGSGGRGGAGGNGGATTGGTTGGSAGAGGSTGGLAGTGGMTGGIAGAGGAAGGASGGGAAGSTGTATEEVIIDLPKNLQTSAVTLGAYGNGGGLVINDGTRVVEGSGGFANVTSVRTTVATDLGVNTRVKDVYSTPNIFVRGSHIYGNVWTSAGLVPNPQQPSVIDGTVQHHVSLDPIRRVSWTVPFPTFAGDPTVVLQGASLSLEPGGKRGITLQQNARLELNRPGVYTLDGPFVMEPNSVLEVDNAGGQVELYIRKDFIFRGTIQKTDPRNNVLIVALGTGDQPIERRFNAILVAPRGNVQLATVTGGHQTSVYAKSILARPNTTITHTPFDPVAFCEEERCSALCPATTGTRECGPGEPCSSSEDCASGLLCDGGVCIPPGDGGPATPCDGNADCQAGLICGRDNGGRFGKAADEDLCWDDGCASAPALGCGSPTSPCGLCEDHPVCESDQECASGMKCALGMGPRFGLPMGVSVCWHSDCDTDPNQDCGTSASKCGLCLCIPTCAGKACGDTSSDGCGGTCPGLCDDGEPGCSSDWECPVGSSCGLGAGPDFGFPIGTNVCWPLRCNDKDPQVDGCGVAGANCGSCDACVPSCSGRECGSDGCGGTCGSCATGEYCNPGGQCASSILEHEPDFPPPLPDANAAAVGTLAGVFSVTDRGAANYSVPIAVPPGRARFQPALTLNYNGSKQDGVLGPGWQISGLSAISVCPTTISAGIIAGPAYYPGSNFCLDGQQLVSVPEDAKTAGPNEWEFRTEIDSFSKVVYRNAENGEPKFFQVYAKDGRILTYGKSAQATVRRRGYVRVWALESVEDRSGNALTVEYLPQTLEHDVVEEETNPDGALLPDSGELVPKTVSYGGHLNGLADDMWVEFDYEDRGDPRFHFVDGARGFALRRLTSITTFVAGIAMRKYVVAYEAPDRTRVLSLEECSGDGARCKPATSFDYEPPGSFQAVDSSWLDIQGSEKIVASMDQNGDGRTDLVLWVPNTNQVRIVRPRTQDGAIISDSIDVPWETPAVSPELVLDINRDGRDDLVDPTGRILVSSSSSFQVLPFERPSGVIRSAVVLDGDGDGLRDLMLAVDNRLVYFRTKDDDFRNGVSSEPVLNVDDCAKMMAIDVDGDQTDEVICVSGSTGEGILVEIERSIEGTQIFFFNVGLELTPVSELKVMDFNGDGLRDILEARLVGYSEKSRQLSIWENTGKDFRRRSVTTHMESNVPSPRNGGEDAAIITHSDLKESVVIDYDGDGRDDLLRRCCRGPGVGESAQSLLLYRATGRFDLVVSDTGLGDIVPTLADIDGDGSLDVTGQSSGVAVSALGTASKAGLLRSVVDGLGKRIRVRYERSTPDAGNPDSSPAPTFDPTGCAETVASQPEVACSNRASALVSEYVESAGSGSDEQRGRRYAYTYRKAYRGLLGRGPYGFGSKTTFLIDDADQVFTTTVSDFYTEFALAGIPKRQVTTYQTVPESNISSAQRTQIERDNQFVVGTSAAERPFPLPTSGGELVRQVGAGIVQKTSWVLTIDEFGILTNRRVESFKGEDTLLEENVTDVVYYPYDVFSWKIGLPQDVSVTSARGGESVTRTTRYVFLPNLLLDSVTREKDDDELLLETWFFRNLYGNAEQIITIDRHGSVRGQVIGYDAQQIYPVTIENAEGHMVELSYHPGTGQVQTYADPNRVFVRNRFDDFGRLVEVFYPDDHQVTTFEPAGAFNDPVLGPLTAVMQAVTTVQSGGSTTQRFDGFGRRVGTESTGFGGTRVEQGTQYDWGHRIVRQSLPHEPGDGSQGLERIEYDPVGRPALLVTPDGRNIEMLFASHLTLKSGFASWLMGEDSLQIAAVMKPRGNVLARVMDHQGSAVVSLESEGFGAQSIEATHKVHFVRRPFGSIREVHDDLGNVITYGIDTLGRVVSVDDPDAGHQERIFSAWSEPVEVTDANNVTRTRKYDRVGRLRRILGADDDVVAEWDYDGPASLNQVGRLLSAYRQSSPGSGTGNTLRYEYELPSPGLGNTARLVGLEQEVLDEFGETVALEIGYSYDQFGRTDVISYPRAGSTNEPFDVRHEYDGESGVLRAVRDEASGRVLWELMEADQGFRIGRERFGNGIESVQDYYSITDPVPACSMVNDSACPVGLLRSISVTKPGEPDPLFQFDYEFDWNLNLKQRSRQDVDEVEGFDYDLFDQVIEHYLVEGTGSVPIASFRYDTLGNIESKTGVGTYDYTGSGRPHAISSIGDTTFTYDGAGNQTRREGSLAAGGVQALDYNDFNMPWRITTGDSGQETLIEYDAFEARVAKRRADGEILYLGDLYERVSTEGQLEHRYKVFAGSQQVAQTTKAESAGVVTDEKTVYLHGDHLGSVSALTDEDGQRLGDVQLFRPFGTPEQDVFSEVRAGFTGHEHDSDLGLINMRGRLYDPELGQFLQPDPYISSSNPRAFNSYAYVMNNPLVNVDPSGFISVGGWSILGSSRPPRTNASDDKNGDGVADEGLPSSGGGGMGMLPDGTLDLTEAGPLYSGGVVGSFGGQGSGDSSSSGSAAPPRTTLRDVTPSSTRAPVPGPSPIEGPSPSPSSGASSGSSSGTQGGSDGPGAWIGGGSAWPSNPGSSLTLGGSRGTPTGWANPPMSVRGNGLGAAPIVVAISSCLANPGCGAAVLATATFAVQLAPAAADAAGKLLDGLGQLLMAERVVNPSKADSPIWKQGEPYRGGLRVKGDEIWDWDDAHNDIEVYDRRGRHLGSRNPTTGELYKPPVRGRYLKDL